MIVGKIAVHRLPGIDQPFAIEAPGHGIHVISGPNGIGKSSIVRAVEGLYWEDRGSSTQTWVSGEFERNGETWLGERDGSSVRWCRSDGSPVAPNLPPAHNHPYFFLRLRNLIDASSESTAEVALEIRRQMSGGFDLDEVASELFTPATQRRRRRQRSDYNNARDAVEQAEVRQAGLQRRVDRLERLQAQVEQVNTAAGRLPHVRRAIGLAGRRRELAGIMEQLRAFPDALPNLTGTEHQSLRDYHGRLAELEERARDIERERQDARTGQQESGLAAPLEEADLAAWRDRADELGRIELELEAARTDREAARSDLAAALHAVGRDNTDTTALDLREHRDLFEFLRASQVIETRVDAVRERLRLLERPDSRSEHAAGEREETPLAGGARDTGGHLQVASAGERGATPLADREVEDGCRLEKLRRLADTMRDWLRAPQPQPLAVRLRSRWRWVLLALAMLLAGGGFSWLMDPLLASITIMGAGIGLAAMFAGNERGSERWKQAVQNALEESGLAQPARWDVPTLTSELRNLERRIAGMEASRERTREREFERVSLRNQGESLAEQQRLMESQRRNLLSALGLESLPPDAELVDAARALDRLRVARGKHEQQTGRVEHLARSHSARLSELVGILERYGEPAPERAAAAKARINRLAERSSLTAQGLDAERSSRKLLEQNGADQAETRASISRVYAKSGLNDGDSAGLQVLLTALPEYRDLTRQRERLESQIELDRTELANAGESRLAAMDRPSLEEVESGLQDAQEEENRLRGEIAEITAETEQARRATDVQKLIAVREDARAGLGELRDQALYAEAGSFLLDEIEREYEQTRMPRVFERARERFSDFTFHRYQLRLDKGSGTPRLFAIEAQGGQRRELHELSDGTRVQLLLAARIAFAEEVEQGSVLPLFLDEALDQSDPQRFEAIVQSLGRVANDQRRQIFYLTSDPLDVERIRNALGGVGCELASEIDLGLIRTGAASVSGADALRVTPPPKIPPPDGLSPEDYGARLRVPAFRPAAGFAQQHLYHVLWDDLSLLYDCLTCGIEWAGQWKTVSGSPLAARLGSRTIDATEIDLRLDLLDVFCELWNQGRGRPVDRDALAASGALSPRFLDDVVAIARERDGDPVRLLAVLASRQDDRLRGFQKRNHERLSNYLAEHQFLDQRPVLTEAELRLQALATPTASALPNGVAAACLQQWWGWAAKSG